MSPPLPQFAPSGYLRSPCRRLRQMLDRIEEIRAEASAAIEAAPGTAELEELIATRGEALDSSELESKLASDRIDVTLPGAPPRPVGHTHLITRTTRQIEDVMVGLGYRVMEGPGVEHDYYNFTALNHPPGHPARLTQDSFYVDPASLPPGVVNEHGLPPGPEDVL